MINRTRALQFRGSPATRGLGRANARVSVDVVKLIFILADVQRADAAPAFPRIMRARRDYIAPEASDAGLGLFRCFSAPFPTAD